MFFRWYSENRHFKKEVDLKGQIAPFLLVVLVILLVAAITTINIGRVAIDKTYTGNAADAGALGAASGMAGIMNGLCDANQQLLDTYVSYHTAYLVILNRAEEHWMIAWITMATISALQIAAIAIAYYYEMQGTISCYQGFALSAGYWVVTGFLVACSSLIHFLLLPNLAALGVDLSAMKQTIEDFHEDCYEAYCTIRDNVDSNTALVEKSAYNLAFANSGISEKLSDAQSNRYSEFIDTEGYTSGVFKWDDKIGQKHTVNVSVNIPRISNYVIQHTVLSYSGEIDVHDQMIADLNDVNETVGMIAISIDTATVSYIILAALGLTIGFLWACCNIPCIFCACCPCCIAWGISCAIWYPAAVIATGYLTFIGGLTSFLMLVSGALGSGTLYGLHDGMEKAWAGLDPNGSVNSSSCGDASDLLIVQFESVPYPGDVTVSSIQTHPGVSSGIVPTNYPSVRSSASASYTGGNVGSFDPSYDSRLSSAN